MVSSRGLGAGPGFWQEDSEQDRSSDASSGTGWGIVAVGFCMNVEVGCKQAAEAAGIPTPSKERLETAWQVTWKKRRLESL